MTIKRRYLLLSGGLVFFQALGAQLVHANDYPPMQLPPMNMHVFAQQQEEVIQPAAPIPAVSADAAPLNMVIFTPEAANNTHLAVAPPGAPENLRLTYNEDNQVLVEQEIHSKTKSRTTKDDYAFLYEFSTGYQRDNLNWNVASPSGSPNPLTEVKWQGINLWGIKGAFEFVAPIGIALKGHAGYAWTLNGSAQETSYLADNRQDAFSLIHANADDGYTWDTSIGAGYQFAFGSKNRDSVSFAMTPYAGYAYQQQKYTMQGGEQLLSGPGITSGALPALDNSYETTWQGPWLGMDAKLSLFNQHELFSSFEYHWANYSADGEWGKNDNTLQRNFTHDANTTGYIVSAGYHYQTANFWGFSLSVDYQNWSSDPGTEVLFLSTGNAFESILNEVERDSLGVNLGLSLGF